jgi:hypothetical protein
MHHSSGPARIYRAEGPPDESEDGGGSGGRDGGSSGNGDIEYAEETNNKLDYNYY